jgi:uncharacterized LabA/DUF88 family protein
MNSKDGINNYAFIDWQNLYRGLEWHIDLKKFREFLTKRFWVKEAFYFLWFKEWEQELYQALQRAGFVVIFNEKPENLKSDKKWNIDVNLTFDSMKKLYEEDFDNMILVSWDWDFKVVVDHFILKNKFGRILFPNKKFASSLYKQLRNNHTYFLDFARNNLEYKK